MPRAISVLLPAFAYVERSVIRHFGLLLMLSLTVLSGSRGALPSIAIALLCYGLLRHLSVSQEAENSSFFSQRVCLGSPDASTTVKGPWGSLARALAWMPLLFFVASTLFLLTLSKGDLTGRGDVYALIRNGWIESPILGQGHDYFKHFFEVGQIGFLPQHEHGQAPFDLNGTGALGWTLMAAGLIQCGLRSRSGNQVQLIALTAALSPIFLTEPVMTVASGGVIWPLFILAILAGQPRSKRRMPSPA